MKTILEAVKNSTDTKVTLIKGNLEYARIKNQLDELEHFYSNVIDVIKQYSSNVSIVNSDIKSSELSGDIFIAHSRGCGYAEYIEKPFFCLDNYEKVPVTWSMKFDKLLRIYKRMDNVPIGERPSIHKGHMQLNYIMEKELRKFLTRYTS